MREYSEPVLFNLLLCSLTLTASAVVCVYGLRGLQKRPTRTSRSNSYRKSKSACTRRLTSLQWLAKAIVICNLLRQLVYFEYYVVQRALFRGFHKNSPMHVICRVNKFFFHLHELWVFTGLFWFQRLIVTFNDSGIASQSLSVAKMRGFYGTLLALFLLNTSLTVLYSVYAADIIQLKSSDLNVYKGVNDNMALCSSPPNKLKFLEAMFSVTILLFLAINAFLAYNYVRKLKVVFVSARRDRSEREQMLVRKSVTVALVTTVSTFMALLCAVALDLWALVALDALVNTLCVVLYFEFASDKYQCLCGRIEACVMWTFAGEKETKLELTNALESNTELGTVKISQLR